MTIFDEWEGRDPLDFENRPKSSKKKRNTPSKSKKPFQKTPAGMAFGCLVWIVAICLIWSSCSKDDSVPVAAPKLHDDSYYRTITPEEQKFIGQHARNAMELMKQYRWLPTYPDVQKWQNKVKEAHSELGHYLYGSRLKEYDDILEAYNSLITVAGAYLSDRKTYYDEKKQNFAIVKRNCAPYLDWHGTPDTSKILKSVTLDWTQCPESDKIQIGKYARYLEEQKNKFLKLVSDPDFIKHGYKINEEEWRDDLVNTLENFTKDVPYEKYDFYMDMGSATFELADAICFANSWRRRPDFKEKVKNSIRLFDERLNPYLEW